MDDNIFHSSSIGFWWEFIGLHFSKLRLFEVVVCSKSRLYSSIIKMIKVLNWMFDYQWSLHWYIIFIKFIDFLHLIIELQYFKYWLCFSKINDLIFNDSKVKTQDPRKDQSFAVVLLCIDNMLNGKSTAWRLAFLCLFLVELWFSDLALEL